MTVKTGSCRLSEISTAWSTILALVREIPLICRLSAIFVAPIHLNVAAEHGIAHSWGLNTRQSATAPINVAPRKLREDLAQEDADKESALVVLLVGLYLIRIHRGNKASFAQC
jgi:hypothetical protein